METNNSIKETAIALMYAVPLLEPLEKFPFLISHPFTDSTVISVKDAKGNMQMIDICETEENKSIFYDKTKEIISRCKSFEQIALFVTKPYRLLFLKMCKPYLSKAEFSRNLGNIWVSVENCNNDVNVSLKTIAKWFESADKKALMSESDYEVYCSLPKEVELYRGVSTGRNPLGFSWTRDFKVAKWFANRFGAGYVQRAMVSKSQVLAYFSTRNEDEYVVNAFKLSNIEKI